MSGPTSVVSGSWLRVLALAVAAFSLGFGTRALMLRRVVGNETVLPGAGDVGAAEAVGLAPEKPLPVPRPSLAEVLAAPALSRLALAARYLDGAGLPEIVTLAEVWEFDHARATEAEWKLVLGCWAEKDSPAALEAATRVGGKDRRFTNLVLLVWTENAPAAALAHAETDPNTLLPVIIVTLARTDMALALEVIFRHFGNKFLVLPVLRILAESDPAAAMARARDLPLRNLRDQVLRDIAEIWAKNDPEAALAWLTSQDDDPSSRALTKTMLETLIYSDPDAAERHVRALSQTKDRYELMNELARKKAKKDPSAALAWAKGLPEGNERKAALAACIEKLAAGDPEKIAALLDEIGWEVAVRNAASTTMRFIGNRGESSGSSSSVSTLLSEALGKLAREDPRDAMRYLARIPDASGRIEAAGEIARNWFAVHPREALAWLAEWPDADRARNVAQKLFFELPAEQGKALHNGFESLSGTWIQQALIESEMRNGRLITTDPDRLVALAKALPETEQNQTLVRIAKVMARTDSRRAFEVAAMLPVGEERDWAYQAVLGRAPLSESQALFDAIPTGERAPALYYSLVSNWMLEDAVAASRWVTGLPEGQARDQAAAGVVRGLVISAKPEIGPALEWLGFIRDGKLRAIQTEIVFQQWLRVDREAAITAMDSAGVAPEARKRLLEGAR